MLSVLKSLISRWIIPASSQIWLLVAGAFGVLVLVVKEMANKLSKEKMKNQSLESEVQKAERIQNVKTTATRDDAIERLSKHGDIRKD